MFLNGHGGYNKDDEQFFVGDFLIVFDHPDDKTLGPALRCIVKRVHMKQLGAWMMARIEIDGVKFSLSGTYGGDGLPVSTVTKDEQEACIRKNWEKLHPLPADIQELFWKDDGHNSSGKNGPAIKFWAIKNIRELKKF